jgi:uncharacterized membrane protein
MANKPGHSDSLGIERVALFSDAVFAIAITLLALEIRLPEEAAHASDPQLLQILTSLWPKYLGYMISFLVIGLFWLGHHRKFRLITRYDSTLLILNLLMLMVVAIVPFPTALLSENGGQLATILYAAFMLVLGLLYVANWLYASNGNRLTDLKPAERRTETLRALASPAIFALSILIALFDANLAKFSWTIIAVFFILPSKSTK